MNAKKKERTIKILEDEIVKLQDEQTDLIRRRWKLEAQITEQRDRIKELENEHIEEQEKKGLWQKTTAFLLAIWVLFLSLFGHEKE